MIELSLQNLEIIANYYLHRLKSQKLWLASIKGLRNGLVYGVRIRAPHALVMVFLFSSGTFWTKLKAVLNLTRMHAFNLGRFVFGYKLGMAALNKWQTETKSWHSFVTAFFVGYFVFGENNSVNTQINLYLLSRIIYGLVKLSVKKGILKQPDSPVFPYFAAITWGVVLWLFENHPETLQNSLQASMSYLYKDSNTWTSIRNFLWFNK